MLGDPRIDKSRINVNVEEGVVVLRGEVDRPEDIERIERRVRDVEDVTQVRNFLHLKNTPAPNKMAARRTVPNGRRGIR